MGSICKLNAQEAFTYSIQEELVLIGHVLWVQQIPIVCCKRLSKEQDGWWVTLHRFPRKKNYSMTPECLCLHCTSRQHSLQTKEGILDVESDKITTTPSHSLNRKQGLER